MRHHRNTLLACASLLALSACSNAPAPDQAASGRAYGRITFQPCTLAEPVSGGNVEAQCATFEVPENRQAPQGRKIALNLAWLPATDEGAATEDPVFFLAGGPGQAATDHAVMIDAALREVRKQRHVVLVDQRGTGRSNPLDCGRPDETSSVAELDALSETAIRAESQRCVDALSQRADLRFYTTTEAIRDLDAVREALGAPRINLIGVSYGTRVAPSNTPAPIRSTPARSCWTAWRRTRWWSAANSRAASTKRSRCSRRPAPPTRPVARAIRPTCAPACWRSNSACPPRRWT